jgi:putative Holliday junction resolvase
MNTTSKVPGRIVGLDIGTRRIGVAVSDELQFIASPETTIIVEQGVGGQADAIGELAALVRRFEAHRVVAGLPRNMKGERGVQAEWTERFVAALREVLNPEHIYVTLYDERLTSVEAARTLRAEPGSRRGKRGAGEGRQTVDARAAALILQGYLDRRRVRRSSDLDVVGSES